MRIIPTGSVVKSSRKNSANVDNLESKSEDVVLDATAALTLFVAEGSHPQKGISSAQTDATTAAQHTSAKRTLLFTNLTHFLIVPSLPVCTVDHNLGDMFMPLSHLHLNYTIVCDSRGTLCEINSTPFAKIMV